MRVVILALDAASSLVSLSPFESGDEGVGERGLGMEERGGRRLWRGCWKAVESDVEAKLESSGLKREGSGVMGMRADASAAEERRSRGRGVEEGGGDMKGGDLSMAAAASEVEGVLENRGRLGCEGLLDCASSSSHYSFAENQSPEP